MPNRVFHVIAENKTSRIFHMKYPNLWYRYQFVKALNQKVPVHNILIILKKVCQKQLLIMTRSLKSVEAQPRHSLAQEEKKGVELARLEKERRRIEKEKLRYETRQKEQAILAKVLCH